MVVLHLRHKYCLENTGLWEDNELTPIWKLMEKYASTNDVDMQLIKDIYRMKDPVELLKQFKIRNHYVIVSASYIIVYSHNKYKIYKNENSEREVINAILEDIPVTDGIDLKEHYDIVNNDIVFEDDSTINLQEFAYIIEVLLSYSDKEVTLNDESSYTLHYQEDVCSINKVKIATTDVMIFNFLFSIKANLLALKTFQIKDVNFILVDNYLIRYYGNDVDYIGLTDNIVSILQFFDVRDCMKNVVVEEDNTPKQHKFNLKLKPRKKEKKRDENKTMVSTPIEEKQEKKPDSKVKKTINKIKKKLLYLVKKPE